MITPEEAFGGAGYGAVQNHRGMFLTIFANVGAAQTGWLDEIDLDGGKLPIAAENIAGQEIGLGTVESSFSVSFKVVNLGGIHGGTQSGFGLDPIFRHPARTCRLCRAAKDARGSR